MTKIASQDKPITARTDTSRTGPAIIYICHGAGPLPLLGADGHEDMIHSLKEMASGLPKPDAVILISAHWEQPTPTITGGAWPPLFYDYYGFPEQAYKIEYPAPGNPELAREIHSRFLEHGMTPVMDNDRGFDHGLFVPLKIMYPEADIPCIQISLLNNLDPAAHILTGEALAGLPLAKTLVIGSGFSFHNMQAFFTPSTPESQTKNESFELWLRETCTDTTLTETERKDRLTNWTSAPSARYCHPREEHLLPLHVCYGIAGRPAEQCVEMTVIGKKTSAFIWT